MATAVLPPSGRSDPTMSTFPFSGVVAETVNRSTTGPADRMPRASTSSGLISNAVNVSPGAV